MDKTETEQFTARINPHMMRVIRKLAKQQGVSINQELNQLLELGLIAKAQKRRAAATARQQP